MKITLSEWNRRWRSTIFQGSGFYCTFEDPLYYVAIGTWSADRQFPQYETFSSLKEVSHYLGHRPSQVEGTITIEY